MDVKGDSARSCTGRWEFFCKTRNILEFQHMHVERDYLLMLF